jgi:phosphohistidine phosphatase
MQLLLIRHAIAEERVDFARTGRDDRYRPLTSEGRKRMRQGARGLKELVPKIDLLATSPLTRAAQTGAILDSTYGDLWEVEIPELGPEAELPAFLAWLQRQKQQTIAVVGHEPHLSQLLAWLVTGENQPFFAFRKGGACLLDLPDEVAPGRAQLLWAMTPSQIRRIGEREKK